MKRNPARPLWNEFSHRAPQATSFTVSYESVAREPFSFHEECRQLASAIATESTGLPLYVCLSGGVDGEVVCRSFLEIGVSFIPVVFEYKKHIQEDLRALRNFVTTHRLDLKTLPFDEESFLKNELPRWAERFPVSEPFIAFDMARIERLDGAVVFGCGDIVLEPSPTGIVSNERGALFQVYDYMEKEKRTGCYQFFQGSAEIMLAFLNEPIIQTWLKLQPEMQFTDSRQFKSYLYKNIWTDLEFRKKWTGYERFAELYLSAQAQLKEAFPIDDQCNLPLAELKSQLQGSLANRGPR